jgi:hypothetical protein
MEHFEAELKNSDKTSPEFSVTTTKKSFFSEFCSG